MDSIIFDSFTKVFQTQNQKVVQVSTFFNLRSIEIFMWRIKKRVMNPQHEENEDCNINYEVAELRLQYPAPNKRPVLRYKINSASDAYDLLKNNWSDQIDILEEFNVLFLDRRNKVIGMMNISKGGYAATVVDAKVIFSSALLAKANSIIAAHNHPSGNLKPSKQDIAMTNKLVEAGKLLDLPIIDHLIITKESYYSFADEGLL